MKKILNALFLTLFTVFTFSSCSDVPAPYDILGEGDVPGLTGDGSKDNPYTVSDLKSKADGTTVAWVQAYIVAGIKSSTEMSISSEDDVVFGTQPADVKATAFLIADDHEESDYKNCSAVNLSGKSTGCSEVKAALNLVDNATTPLPRLVTLKGTLVKNTWGLPGLKEVTAAVLEDGTLIGEGGEDEPGPSGNVVITKDDAYEVSFASSLADFTVKNVISEGLKGDVWYISNKYEAATASSYTGSSNVAAEGWLLSPVMDMSSIDKATLTFTHSSYRTGDSKELMLKIKEESASEWTDLTISNYSSSRDEKVITTVDISAYAKKKAQIAFVYKNEADGSNNTWYIYSLKVAAGEGGEQPTSETVVVTAEQPYEETFAENVGKFTIAEPIGDLSYIWKVDTRNKYIKGSCYNGVPVVAEGWLISPVIDLSSISKTTLTFMQNSYSEGLDNEFMLKVRIDGMEEWTDLTFEHTAGSWAELETTVDLSAYDTKKIQLAFVCKNENTSKSNTWEIWNFKVAAGENGGEVDPEPSNVFSSNIVLPTEDNATDSYYGGEIKIDGVSYSILKLGTSSKIGTWTSQPFGKSVTKLSFYALGWKNQTATLIVTLEDGGTFAGGSTTQTISLTSNEGITGNPPYTIDTPSSSDFFEYILNDVTANTKVKFMTDERETTKNRRAVIFGVNIK